MGLFCQYKNILGAPETGFHASRLFGFATMDVIGTFGLAWALSKFTGQKFWKSLIFMFTLAQCLHWMFCVDTAFMKLLTEFVGGSNQVDVLFIGMFVFLTIWTLQKLLSFFVFGRW